MQVSQVVPVTYCLHRHVPFWGLHCVVAMVPAASQPQDVQLREGEGGREGERGGGRVKWGRRTGGGMEEWNRMGTKLSRYHLYLLWKLEEPREATITCSPPHSITSTRALPSHGITHTAFRPLQIAVACYTSSGGKIEPLTTDITPESHCRGYTLTLGGHGVTHNPGSVCVRGETVAWRAAIKIGRCQICEAIKTRVASPPLHVRLAVTLATDHITGVVPANCPSSVTATGKTTG